jgi:hypothetical protein
MAESDLPFFAFTPRASPCHFLTTAPIVALKRSAFLARALNGSIPCGRAPTSAAPAPLPAVSTRPNGLVFLGAAFTAGLSLIGALQLRNPPERKSE